MTKRDKTTVDDIIGIVHTDEPTDSVDEVRKLRGRDNEKHFFKIIDEKLNELHEENQQLKEQRHEDINDLSVIAMKYQAIEKENERLKSELQWIYDVATLKKARDIVDEVYDDLLYETSEKSDYARNKVLECLEKLDMFGDELE